MSALYRTMDVNDKMQLKNPITGVFLGVEGPFEYFLPY
jgi:hypothetical protein